MIIFDCEWTPVKIALHIHSTALLPLKALWKEFKQLRHVVTLLECLK